MPTWAEKLQKSEAEKSSRQGNLSHFNGWLDAGVTYHSGNVPPQGKALIWQQKKRSWRLEAESRGAETKGASTEILR